MHSAMYDVISSALTSHLQQDIVIDSVASVGGGCINECFSLHTNAGRYFLKVNSAKEFPGMFAAEAKGLTLLHSVSPGFVPQVIFHFEDNDEQYLVVEFIDAGNAAPDLWEDFAVNLATLHRHSSAAFGLEFDNYMGSLQQENTFENNWVEFFILHRIEPQLRLAVGSKQLSVESVRRFNKLFSKLGSFFPHEPPALIHGDLWGGNYMTGPDGHARIIDPVVYYGHREMDIAMTKLFGGFDRSFYELYNIAFPLEKRFEERADVCNLYPLLIHVNLFGGHYASQVEGILKRFA